MKSVQLTFGGGVYVAPSNPRKGRIGKVERFLDNAAEWLTCGEIAARVNEPSWHVSECLNKLKHEGKAAQEPGLGEHRKWVWSGTSEHLREERAARLRESIVESDTRMAAQMAGRLSKAFLRAGASHGEVSCA